MIRVNNAIFFDKMCFPELDQLFVDPFKRQDGAGRASVAA
jgi:hypothetical protein